MKSFTKIDSECSAHFSLGQEHGVNDFYMELFKWWSLKTSRPSSVSASVPVVDLEDSGDESGDLSIIMEVKVKSDPYSLDGPDACSEAATIYGDLKEYATSTMAALNEAMDSVAEDEYLEPEYPDPLPADPLPLGEPTMSSEVPVPEQLEPAMKPSVPVPDQGQPGMPPPAPVKGFQELDQAMTVKDVEEKIRQLKCIGIGKFFFSKQNGHTEGILMVAVFNQGGIRHVWHFPC